MCNFGFKFIAIVEGNIEVEIKTYGIGDLKIKRHREIVNKLAKRKLKKMFGRVIPHYYLFKSYLPNTEKGAFL